MFICLARKKNYIINTITIKNIDKALNSKKRFDSTIFLLFKFYKFLDIISCILVDKLFAHRFYNIKILLLNNKMFIFDSLYSISRDKLFCYCKYLDNIFKKSFIHFSYLFATTLVLFVCKFNKNLYFCVNY